VSELLIAVDHRENARLLKGYLDQHYSTAAPPAADQLDIPFDLGIFDGHALSRFWSQIQLRKQTEQPLFLPILLITPRQDINMITRQLWRSIDEIIFAPIEKAELFVRVEILLRARQLSLELQGKNIHLQNEIVSHKETEQFLRESEDRFRAALKNSPVMVARMDHDLRYTWVYNQPIFQPSDLLGKRDDEVPGLENVQNLMDLKRSVLSTGIGARQEVEIGIFGTYKAYDVTVEPILEDNAVTSLRTTAVDITERKHAEQRILQLYDLVLELSKSLTLKQVAKNIINYGINALGATAGTVVMLDDKLQTLQSIYSIDGTVEDWQSISIELARTSLADAIKTKSSLVYRALDDQLTVPASGQNVLLDEEHKVWAFLPFEVDEKMLGGLGLCFPFSKTFDDAERGFMLTLAHQCAQAIDRVYISEQLQHSAVLAERHRLARDLHDAVSQALFAATTIADSVPQMWEKKPEKARELLQQLTSLNRGALAEMRTLLFELRPEALVKTNLRALLLQLLDAVKARKVIETNLTVTGDPTSLPEDIHMALYRIAQESLNNVVKHSQAAKAHVVLNYNPGRVVLQIIDNGQGFDTGQSTGGLGRGSMRERAEAAQMQLQIHSAIGDGTHVEVIWNPSE
jgi:signal transduction histidine kinase